MHNRNRDLLILLKATSYSEAAFNKHLNELHQVLVRVERNDVFCVAHELVTRNQITSKKSKLLRAIAKAELKPFYFLINKN
jgi:hypothetical protein